MSDFATALNDPAFWRWHKRINELFTKHKDRMPPYTSKQLGFEGVTIKSFKVQTNNETAKDNEFLTLREGSHLDLSNGTRSSQPGAIMYCYYHPQHYPFDYSLEVESDKNTTAIVRIFMAPTFDENGKEFDFNKQREMFIEMDTFVLELVNGSNQIKRRSVDSSVTAPSQQTFMRIPMDPNVQPNLPKKIVHSDCGLPDYLLLPRGTVEGLKTKLFVIISDYESDKVDDIQASEIDKHAAASFCGIVGKPYPFQRPMGFPFDRRHEENSLSKFSSLPNMRVIDTTIRYLNLSRPATLGEVIAEPSKN